MNETRRVPMKDIEDMIDEEFQVFMNQVLAEYRNLFGSYFVDDLNEFESQGDQR